MSMNDEETAVIVSWRSSVSLSDNMLFLRIQREERKRETYELVSKGRSRDVKDDWENKPGKREGFLLFFSQWAKEQCALSLPLCFSSLSPASRLLHDMDKVNSSQVTQISTASRTTWTVVWIRLDSLKMARIHSHKRSSLFVEEGNFVEEETDKQDERRLFFVSRGRLDYPLSLLFNLITSLSTDSPRHVQWVKGI